MDAMKRMIRSIVGGVGSGDGRVWKGCRWWRIVNNNEVVCGCGVWEWKRRANALLALC